MIRLNVFIRTTDSNREEVVNTAKELVAASLKDEGCVAYGAAPRRWLRTSRRRISRPSYRGCTSSAR